MQPVFCLRVACERFNSSNKKDNVLFVNHMLRSVCRNRSGDPTVPGCNGSGEYRAGYKKTENRSVYGDCTYVGNENVVVSVGHVKAANGQVLASWVGLDSLLYKP